MTKSPHHCAHGQASSGSGAPQFYEPDDRARPHLEAGQAVQGGGPLLVSRPLGLATCMGGTCGLAPILDRHELLLGGDELAGRVVQGQLLVQQDGPPVPSLGLNRRGRPHALSGAAGLRAALGAPAGACPCSRPAGQHAVGIV